MEVVIGLFIIFPLGATLIGALYLRMYFKVKAKISLLTGILWIIYSIYEHLINTRLLCTGECNIRIDLLVIYPLLLAMSLISTGQYLYKKIKIIKNK